MTRTHHLKTKYGITTEQYDDLLRRQGGCCAVCGRSASNFRVRLAVDHDHASGFIRGLLCIHCNRYVVGRHKKDSADILLNAYKYLISDYPGWIVPKKKRRKKRRWATNTRTTAKSLRTP